MNLGPIIVLLELLKDAGGAVSPIGPPAPNGEVRDPEIKPICGPGSYATKTAQGHWVCVPIPKGR